MHIAGLVQKLAQNRRLVKLFFCLKTSAFNFLFLFLSFILLDFFIILFCLFNFSLFILWLVRNLLSLYANASMSLCINVFVCIDQISGIEIYIFFCLIGRIRLLYMKCFSNPIWAKFLICGLIKKLNWKRCKVEQTNKNELKWRQLVFGPVSSITNCMRAFDLRKHKQCRHNLR